MAGDLKDTALPMDRIRAGSEAFSLALFDMTGNIKSGAVTLVNTLIPALRSANSYLTQLGLVMSSTAAAAAQLGTKTKDELVQDLELAIAAFESLASTGQMTAESEKTAIQKIVDANSAAGKSFSDLPQTVRSAALKIMGTWADLNQQIVANFLTAISSIITGQQSLVTALQSLWTALVSMAVNEIGSLMKKFMDLKESIGKSFTDMVGTTAGAISVALVAVSAFATIGQALANASDQQMANALDALKQRIIGLYGVTDTLAAKMAKMALQFGITAAASHYLLDRMKDTGVTLANFNQYAAEATANLEKIGKDSRLTGQELSDANDEFQLLIDAAKKLGLEGTSAIQDFILKARAMGLEIASVTAYVQEQLNKIPAALKDLVDHFDETGGSIQNLGTIAVATFGDMLASGMSFPQAIAAMQGSLAALSAEYKKLGLTADPALQSLLDISDIVQANQGLFNSIDDLVTITTALNNSAWMTKDTFNALESQAEGYYSQLLTSGLTSEQALREMSPMLQQLYNASKQWGFALDPVTQSLVDQALQLGTIKSASDADPMKTMSETLKTIATVLERIAESMGIFVQDLIDGTTAANALGNALGNISIPSGSGNPGPGNPGTGGPGGGGRGNPPSFANEGIAWRPQMASVAERGPEIIGSLSDYMAGRPIAGIPQTGGGGAGGGMVIHISQTINAQTLDRQTIDRSAELLYAAIQREATRRGQ